MCPLLTFYGNRGRFDFCSGTFALPPNRLTRLASARIAKASRKSAPMVEITVRPKAAIIQMSDLNTVPLSGSLGIGLSSSQLF
jgi:hypothetical protein